VLSSKRSTSPGFVRAHQIEQVAAPKCRVELYAHRPIGIVEFGPFGRGEIPIAHDIELGRDLVDDGAPLALEI
jgi:hypothetical protein